MFFSFLDQSTKLSFILLSTLLLITSIPAQTVYFVDDSSEAPSPEGTSWASAYPTIQSAIDEAVSNGASEATPAEIWVAEGTYTDSDENVIEMAEYIDLYGGFAGTETELDQRDWNQYTTTIDGEETRRGALGADHAIFDGFTIINGNAADGCGILLRDTSPTISNCIFRNSNADSVEIINSSAKITNCSFFTGSGLKSIDSNPTITSCFFYGNEFDNIYCILNDNSTPIISNCFFYRTNNSALCNYNSSPTISNCVFVMITAPSNGAGIKNSNSSFPTITNCIFWDNDNDILNMTHDSAPVVTYCCLENMYEGEGNISQNPLFWDIINGDFHLHSNSPCLDSGKTTSPLVTIIGDGADMGIYEMDEEDSDNDGLYNKFEINISESDPNNPDTDNNGTNDFDEWFSDHVLHVNTNNSKLLSDGKSWDTAFSNIQEAVHRSYIQGNHPIWVAEGVYTGTENSPVKLYNGVELYGGFQGTEVDPDLRNWELNKSIIEGENTHRCLTVAKNSVVDGFTFRNGKAPSGANGGAVYAHKFSPTFSNCTFTSNSATRGGAIALSYSNSIISNCHFINNSAALGGGIYITSSSPSISSCIFKWNTCSNSGGGAICNRSSSISTITNCLFAENTGYIGGAILNHIATGTIMNCTFANNTASRPNAGIIMNYNSSPAITNCIFNEDDEVIILDGSGSDPKVTYCRLTGPHSQSDNNIETLPLFVDPDSDNYMLQYNSPCIDRGTPTGAPDVDINGVLRPCGSGIDMGAYEMKNSNLFILN